MKLKILFYLLFLAQVSLGQKLDTIYCNASQNVVITTPAPIFQATTSSDHFVFSYNQASPDSLGLLQGKPGHSGNLFIRTTEGGLFHFLLVYRDTLALHAYFLTRKDQLNPPASKKPGAKTVKESGLKPEKQESNFEKLSAKYRNISRHRMAVEHQDGILLEVLGIKYTRNETFLIYRVKNRSSIDFQVSHLELFSVIGRKGRKSAYQEIGLEPLYKYKMPRVIRPSGEAKFVVAYERFTMTGEKKLKAVLTEERGSRQVTLEFQ